MSLAVPTRPRLASRATLSFAIITSQYNQKYTDALTDHAFRELNILEPGVAITLITAPGAFEIPLLVQSAAALDRYQAILALGLILEGETEHAALIARSVTDALLKISLERKVPVIHGVLLVKNEDQARARCLDTAHNRGTEAARAAVAAARSLREIK